LDLNLGSLFCILPYPIDISIYVAKRMARNGAFIEKIIATEG
jgi:hypothetical protein